MTRQIEEASEQDAVYMIQLGITPRAVETAIELRTLGELCVRNGVTRWAMRRLMVRWGMTRAEMNELEPACG